MNHAGTVSPDGRWRWTGSQWLPIEQQAGRPAGAQRVAAKKKARELAGSPIDRARDAFKRGDQVFQCSIDVMSQQAITVTTAGRTTARRTSDPSEVLNAVSREGWQLVNGSFGYVEEGSQPGGRAIASSRSPGLQGTTFGYYLFRRNPALREVAMVWD